MIATCRGCDTPNVVVYPSQGHICAECCYEIQRRWADTEASFDPPAAAGAGEGEG